MSALSKSLAVGSGSLLVLSGIAGAAAVVSPDVAAADTGAVEVAQDAAKASFTQIALDTVEGIFSFTQNTASSNEEIKAMAEASKYLCASQVIDTSGVSAQDWELTVQGDVAQGYTQTFAELSTKAPVQSALLGCACAANVADGRAAVNAQVTGISALTLIEMAKPAANANTVVFTSADGYEVAIPLSYLENRYSPIVFNVNGAELAESIGGTNQLWLGSTAANYFARDVVAITVETRQTPPPSPNSAEGRDAYANLPNIGVLFGGEVA